MKSDNKNLFDIEKLTDCYLEEMGLFGDINFKTFCEFLEWNISFLKIDTDNKDELANIFNSVVDGIIKKMKKCNEFYKNS